MTKISDRALLFLLATATGEVEVKDFFLSFSKSFKYFNS